VFESSGYNALRLAHNPPSPAFLEACDRLGMMVIDEAFDMCASRRIHTTITYTSTIGGNEMLKA